MEKFVDLNLDKFEIIIWKNLKYPKSLNLLIDDLLQVCKQESKKTLDDKIKQLFKILTEQKCLIILDDIQNIFVTGEFAGEYQTEYQDYQNFFTLITKTAHQSNVILISQEQCAEMESIDEELYSIKSLELSGLYDAELLKNTGLKNEDSWLRLIQLYAGNPAYLKSIANSISRIYDGEVAEFLAENDLVITKDMQVQFNQILQKISPIEKQIILALSKFDQPVFRADLKVSLDLSSTDFINGLESLQQRYVIQKIKYEKILFQILPVFREYVRNFYS